MTRLENNSYFSDDLDSLSHVIYNAAIEGVAPFRPGVLAWESDYDIDFDLYWVRIEARFGNAELSKRVSVSRSNIMMEGYTTLMLEGLFVEIRDLFRHRGTEPSGDNVFLGEN